MEVDTATRALLEMMRASDGKPLYEMTIEEARAGVRTMGRQLGAPPIDLPRVVDRTIPGPDGDIRIRVYAPHAASGPPLPIVMHYHGGGFAAGDLDSHDTIARYYAKHGDAVVVSVDYRLAPEHKFPAAAEDSYAALCWAADHAEEIAGDHHQIAVTGDSAGGNLSAVVCLLAKVRGGPPIVYQALMYPCLDFDVSSSYPSRTQFGGGEYFLSNRDMEWFGSLYFNDAPREGKDIRASPLHADDLSGLPSALVVTAGCDLLRDEGKAYADRLSAAGVPVEYRCYAGTVHAFASFSGVIPSGGDALSLTAARLRAALHGVAEAT